MTRRPKGRYPRQPVNLTIPGELAEEAREYGTNMSAVLERALNEEHRAKRRAEWQAKNENAIAEANAELAENGLWSDGLRLT